MPFLRGLSMEGNLRFQIDWASLIVGSKFTVFALFYFVFEGNFQVQAPRGAYIWRGDLTEGFLGYEFGRLIFGGVYTRRGLFLEFLGTVEPPLTGHLSTIAIHWLSFKSLHNRHFLLSPEVAVVESFNRISFLNDFISVFLFAPLCCKPPRKVFLFHVTVSCIGPIWEQRRLEI